jgi:paraquat-inducible protein B
VFGTVKSLALSPDQTHVVVTVATTHEAGPLLTEGTVFWVVKPRLFPASAAGNMPIYDPESRVSIPEILPAKSQRDFVGREDPPVLSAHVPGHTFLLKSKRIGAVSVGSPIFFRDLAVGEVLGWDIADMAEYVTIHAFVRALYDRRSGGP